MQNVVKIVVRIFKTTDYNQEIMKPRERTGLGRRGGSAGAVDAGENVDSIGDGR